MLPAESGTLPHRPWKPMSLVNGRSPQAKRCGRDGAKRKSVRKRLPLRGSRSAIIGKQLPPGTAQSTIGKQLHSAKHGTLGEELPAGKPHGSIGKQLHSAKHGIIERQLPPRRARCSIGGATCRTSTIATCNLPNRHLRGSNLPNQQHREADVLSNNGAKWAGAEGVRGSNLACFLKNFVSNYIVIFLMMLFRVHL